MLTYVHEVGKTTDYPIDWRRTLGDAEIVSYDFEVPDGLRLVKKELSGTATIAYLSPLETGDFTVKATVQPTDGVPEVFEFVVRGSITGREDLECIIPEIDETPLVIAQGCTTTIPITIDPPFPASRAIMYIRRSQLGRLIAKIDDLRLTTKGDKLYVNFKASDSMAVPASTFFYGIRLVGDGRQCEIARGPIEFEPTYTVPLSISYNPKFDQYGRFHANKEECIDDECPDVCTAAPTITLKDCAPSQCRQCRGSDKLVFFVNSDGLKDVAVTIPNGIYRILAFTGNGYVKDLDFSTNPKRARIEVTHFCEEICENGCSTTPTDSCDCASTYTYTVQIEATDVCDQVTTETFDIKYTPPRQRALPDNVMHRRGVRYSLY